MSSLSILKACDPPGWSEVEVWCFFLVKNEFDPSLSIRGIMGNIQPYGTPMSPEECIDPDTGKIDPYLSSASSLTSKMTPDALHQGLKSGFDKVLGPS